MIDVDDDNIWRVNLFDILEVEENTDPKTLKQQYKTLAKQYHPDRFPAGSAEQEEAKGKFSDIGRAYDILSNETKRKQYTETRRLLADHLPEEQRPDPLVQEPSASPQAASYVAPSPAAEAAEKKSAAREDFKAKEANTCFEEGQFFFNKTKLDEAVESFQRAVSIVPDEAKYHSHLGRAFLMKGWTGMAQASFKQALVLNPNDAIAKKHYEPEKPKKKGIFGGLFAKKDKKSKK